MPMVLVTPRSNLEGYQVATYKGIAQGSTIQDLVREAKALGANVILNTCYDNALDIETLYHGTAVLVKPARPLPNIASGFQQASRSRAQPGRSTRKSTLSFHRSKIHEFNAGNNLG